MQARMIYNALPSSFQKEHNAYYRPTNKKIKQRVERHKLTCLEETVCPPFKNKNNAD
jgi:hypothetical protein